MDDEYKPPVVVSGLFVHGKMVNADFRRRKVGADEVVVFRVGCVDI